MKAKFTELFDVKVLKEIIKSSNEKPVYFFKHSVVCPISTDAFRELQEIDAEFNVIIVQEAESVSAEMTRFTGLIHESPQLVVIRDEEVVYHAAQTFITAEDLNFAIKTEFRQV